MHSAGQEGGGNEGEIKRKGFGSGGQAEKLGMGMGDVVRKGSGSAHWRV